MFRDTCITKSFLKSRAGASVFLKRREDARAHDGRNGEETFSPLRVVCSRALKSGPKKTITFMLITLNISGPVYWIIM